MQVTWTRNQRPDFELMNDEQYVIKIPSNVNDYKITFQTRKDYQNEIHYIGIFADTTVRRNFSLPSVF